MKTNNINNQLNFLKLKINKLIEFGSIKTLE